MKGEEKWANNSPSRQQFVQNIKGYSKGVKGPWKFGMSGEPEVCQSRLSGKEAGDELLRLQAKYAQAKNLLERASQILEKNPGPETPEVATACAGLAEIYYKLGDTAAAETKAKKSLKIRKKIQGEEHPDVAKSLNDLAAVYWHEGKWTEAEPLFEKALSIREKALPAQSPLIAQSEVLPILRTKIWPS